MALTVLYVPQTEYRGGFEMGVQHSCGPDCLTCGHDCLIYGPDRLIYGPDCLLYGPDCLICAIFAQTEYRGGFEMGVQHSCGVEVPTPYTYRTCLVQIIYIKDVPSTNFGRARTNLGRAAGRDLVTEMGVQHSCGVEVPTQTRIGRIPGCYVIKFAPHKALKLIA